MTAGLPWERRLRTIGPGISLTAIAPEETGSVVSRMTCEAIRLKLRTRVHTSSLRPLRFLATALVLGAVLAAGLVVGPSPAAALGSGQPVSIAFPRLGMWWPGQDTQPVADRARYDWVGMQNWDTDHIAELRAANPGIKLFGSNSAVKLAYVVNDYNNYKNVELRSASLTWALTQVGSTLTSAINSTAMTVPVAEITKSGLTLFAVGDVFIIDNELFQVTSISGLNLTVQRGTYMGTPAAPHARGARVANACSDWPGNLIFDVTPNCPTADVGYGPEHWNDWNARRLHTELQTAGWDGIIVDWMIPSISWLPGSSGNNGLPVRFGVDPLALTP